MTKENKADGILAHISDFILLINVQKDQIMEFKWKS
jgi:hypothetical protein